MKTINDFKVGQKAYILLMNYNRRLDKEQYVETEVLKVGRKYVEVRYCGRIVQFENAEEEYLIEHSEYTQNFLFSSKQEVLDFIESLEIRNWILVMVQPALSNLPLEKLRQIKSILLEAKNMVEKDGE